MGLFCQELYYKPVQELAMAGDNPETPREDPEEADPDYSVQQDQEMLLEPHDEFQFDFCASLDNYTPSDDHYVPLVFPKLRTTTTK